MRTEEDVGALHRAVHGGGNRRRRRVGSAELLCVLRSAFSEGRLFTVFVDGSTTMVPCFCVVAADDPHSVEMIWVAAEWRRRGLASTLVRSLGVSAARRMILHRPPARAFWAVMGVEDDGLPPVTRAAAAARRRRRRCIRTIE